MSGKTAPKSHFYKNGTPTMGGLLIIFATLVATLLWSELNNPFIWMMIVVTLGFGFVGFYDDYLKVIKKHNRGLTGRTKLMAQTLVALVPAIWLYAFSPSFNTTLTIPFFKQVQPDLGWFFIPFAVFIIVGSANAVNLTDGLDGLAIGPVTIAAGFYMIFCYLAGNLKIATYLQIPHVRGVGELSIFLGALVGSGIGFLWFNAYPAQVFMGDVGALALGGALGTVALATKQEILLAIVGGSSWWKPCRLSCRWASSRFPTANASFAWRPCTITSNSRGGPNPRSSCASGSSPLSWGWCL